MQPDYELVILPSASEIVIADDNTVLDMNMEASLEVIGIAKQGPPGPAGTDGIPVIPEFIDLGSFA